MPLEVCLTSNVKTQSVPSYAEHHFRQLHARGYPLALCTDDRGVFQSALADEYALAARAFGLGAPQLFELARAAVPFAFQPPAVRHLLLQRFDSVRAQLLQSPQHTHPPLSHTIN